jgi:hypothetical protein
MAEKNRGGLDMETNLTPLELEEVYQDGLLTEDEYRSRKEASNIRRDYSAIYDVCNDYSLDPVEHPFNFSEYRIVAQGKGFLLIHKEYGELHYYIGAAGLTGKRVYGGIEP